MLSPEKTAEALVDGAQNLHLTPTEIISLHKSLHPTISSPERSQLFQESNLWALGEKPKIPRDPSRDKQVATWQKSLQHPSRSMADVLHDQAFPPPDLLLLLNPLHFRLLLVLHASVVVHEKKKQVDLVPKAKAKAR